MKRTHRILLGVALAFAFNFVIACEDVKAAETTNTHSAYAHKQLGTVGAMVSAAQAECIADTSISCYIELEAVLANFPVGVMPTKCSQCVWNDYRTTAHIFDTIAASATNLVGHPEMFAGATADVKINACLAAYAVCDATGFGATTQTIAATVEVGAGGAYKRLLLDHSTSFIPSGASTPTVMFKVDRNGQLEGGRVVLQSGVAYTGKMFDVEDMISGPGPGANNLFSIKHIACDGSATANTATCLHLAPPSGGYIQLVTIDDVQSNNVDKGLYLFANGPSGYINGNNFSNMVVGNGTTMLTLNGGSGSLGIVGNLFNGLQLDSGTAIGISYIGSAQISDNTFLGHIWDTLTPISNTNTAAISNTFTGNIDFTVTDPNSSLATTTGNFRTLNVYNSPGGHSNVAFPSYLQVDTNPSYIHTSNVGMMGWNSTGFGDIAYYTAIYPGTGNYAHAFYSQNSTNTAWQLLGGFLGNGQFRSANGSGTPTLTCLADGTNCAAPVVTGAPVNLVAITATNTGTGGRSWEMISSGTGGYCSTGGFCIWDNTFGADRFDVSPSLVSTALPLKAALYTVTSGQAVPITSATTPTAGAGVCWKTTTTLGTCTAGTWPNCTTCN